MKALREIGLILFAVGLISLCGCSGPAQRKCMPGTYSLDLDNRVQLILYLDSYQLVVGADKATGTYHLNAEGSTITFQAVSGGIGENSLKTIHDRIGPSHTLDAVLGAMAQGHSPYTYDISQDPSGAVYINVDSDGTNFVKKSC